MRRRRSGRSGLGVGIGALIAVLVSLYLIVVFQGHGYDKKSSTGKQQASISISSSLMAFGSANTNNPVPPPSLVDYEVEQECKQLPFIRPMGSYFLNTNVGKASSPEGVDPPFKIGSNFGEKAMWHMSGDKAHFQLIKELLQNNKGGLTLDIGANQGFFTWYLAALGMEVHAFEIFEENIIALQHGAEFNEKEIAKRVHLYPVGLGRDIGRMGMGGANYDGHLQNSKTGPILASSFDCFAYHNIETLGNDLINNVAFVKLDVEGFEIAVLLGAKKSMFGPNGKVGGMLMEVGPSRWERARVSFEMGVGEMKYLSTRFQNSYLIVRKCIF